jgi:hypothetical protein
MEGVVTLIEDEYAVSGPVLVVDWARFEGGRRVRVRGKRVANVESRR